MLTAGDALAKTLAKSQKIIFWNQKNGFGCFFFLLTAVDALSIHRILSKKKKKKVPTDLERFKLVSSKQIYNS